MSVLSVLAPREDEERLRPRAPASQEETAPEPEWLDAAMANWRLAWDAESDQSLGNLISGYNDLADQMIAQGRPASRYGRTGQLLLGGKPDVPREMRDLLWADVTAARRADPRLFADVPDDRAAFEKWARNRGEAGRRDAAIAARGGFGTSLAPSLVQGITRSLSTPEGMVELALGGGAKSIAETMLRQFWAGAVGSAAQAPDRALTAIARGQHYTPDDLGRDILIGGAANAALAGAVRRGDHRDDGAR